MSFVRERTTKAWIYVVKDTLSWAYVALFLCPELLSPQKPPALSVANYLLLLNLKGKKRKAMKSTHTSPATTRRVRGDGEKGSFKHLWFFILFLKNSFLEGDVCSDNDNNKGASFWRSSSINLWAQETSFNQKTIKEKGKN